MQDFIERLKSKKMIGFYCYNIAPYNIQTFLEVINFIIDLIIDLIDFLGT